MGHDHAHGTANRRRLAIALAIVGVFLVVEVVGAILSGSLALLADAGHMVSDVIGLTVALVASVIAENTDWQGIGWPVLMLTTLALGVLRLRASD